MVQHRFDKRQEEEYPPMEFCKNNCDNGGVESLAIQHEKNSFYLEGSKHGIMKYWLNRSKIRRAECNNCPEAENYFIQKELQQAKENLFKIIEESKN